MKREDFLDQIRHEGFLTLELKKKTIPQHHILSRYTNKYKKNKIRHIPKIASLRNRYVPFVHSPKGSKTISKSRNSSATR